MNKILFKQSKYKIKPYIIAEVGQNHNGSLDSALKYIDEFSALGANAVKFQARKNQILFSKSALEKKYESDNSFGKTYGEHRDFLELSKKDFLKIKKRCIKNKVDFICTPFDEQSLKMLLEIGVDALKIASFDLGNLPLINKISKSKKPIILSIGGGNKKQIDESVKVIKSNTSNFAIMHCVSEYPCSFDRLGLQNILNLKKRYPSALIGLSDHYNGILSASIGYTLGARIFEKHVTFDRSNKGTDHSFSLEKEGFRKMVRDLNRIPFMYKPKPIKEIGKEKVFQKLGKIVIAKKNFKKGHKLSINDIDGIINQEKGIAVRDSYKILNKVLKQDISKGDRILYMHIK